MLSTHYYYYYYYHQIFKRLEFCRQIFEEYTNIKFHENLCSGSGGVPCGQTDRQSEAGCRFSQFCERA